MEQEQKQLDAIDKTLCVLISIELALFFIMLIIRVWWGYNDLIGKIVATDLILFAPTLLFLKVYSSKENKIL